MVRTTHNLKCLCDSIPQTLTGVAEAEAGLKLDLEARGSVLGRGSGE
jgi:hypothetical protein